LETHYETSQVAFNYESDKRTILQNYNDDDDETKLLAVMLTPYDSTIGLRLRNDVLCRVGR